ncbi:MAG: serine hydrolase [Oligoflexia bacterium]|nr:serine hydrolase [Oligoflexia bacterium]
MRTAYNLLMDRFVFSPLKMDHTVLDTESAYKSGAASPHEQDYNDETKILSPDISDGVYSLAPAGAIWSTVEDLAKYVLMELNDGKIKTDKKSFSEDVYIDKNILEKRRKPGIKSGAKFYYGLGLVIEEKYGMTLIGHGGAIDGFISNLFFIPENV